MNKKYYSLNDYLIDTFGEKVYKLSLSAAVTCPNRDGKCSTDGCIFCSGGGSGEFAADKSLPIEMQIEQAKKKIRNKTKAKKFIAYFQSFTNTYAPVEYLRKIFYEAIKPEDIVALSIATRPDCLPEDVLALLAELNTVKPVWIELGLQTTNENTAKLINRGYPLSVYDEAVKNLKKINVNIITHIILGLPSENIDDMLNSVSYVCTATNGIKLQLLHVLKGTKLEQMYNNREFSTLSLEQYTEILKKCLEIIPKTVVIHRLTGDGDKKLLIAPLWSADKKRVLNTINKAINTL